MRPLGTARRAPAGERRGEADGGDRVAAIVLAVPERALAVLPRFATVNRRERDKQRRVRIADDCRPRGGRERAPLFERMPIRRVMIDARRVGHSAQRTADDVRFGGMEITARWIDA